MTTTVSYDHCSDELKRFIDEYILLVNNKIYSKNNDERLGQACFNVLYDLEPEIADWFIRGRFNVDCFYDDSKIPAMELEVFGMVIYGDRDLSDFGLRPLR